ncbi:MAG TPA: endonuclease III [Candidatus Krumholzibacteria bacterium]|nr:endonuclease III [Candidatus Krumholzibacteria bacterium]
MKRQTARTQRRRAPRPPRPALTGKGGPKSKQAGRPAPKKGSAAANPVRPAPVTATPELRRRALRLFDGLKEAYPDARCELDFSNALEALVASILAAQCTDARVNLVTPALFRKYPTPQHYLDTPDAVLQDEIRSTGFFNNKTKAIKAACRVVVEDFAGRMPDDMDDLLKLPGVGRKTANVILTNIYGVPGVVVDTHMLRNSKRMGFSANHDADKVERDMMAVFPASTWIELSHLMPWHGRRCCTARKPMCDECPVANDCPKLID